METFRMTGMTQKTGANNIVIHALNVKTMEKKTLHARIEEIPFFQRVFDTGENFMLDENSVVYTDNCQPITKP